MFTAAAVKSTAGSGGTWHLVLSPCSLPHPMRRSPAMHGETEKGETIAAAVLPAIQGLDDDRVRFYYDLVYNPFNAAARRALEG
jgi:hypothetical protein